MKTDVWFIYSGYILEKKKESGYLDKLIKKAKEEYGLVAEARSCHSFAIVSGTENEIYYEGKKLSKEDLPKYVIMRRYEIYLGRQLELMGVKVFNNIQALTDARNKLKVHQILSQNGISTPKTLYIIPKRTKINSTYEQVCEYLGSNKFVLKWIYGSQGAHVYLVDNKEEYDELVRKYEGKILCQEYIESSYGRDIRAYVIGGKFIGAAMRKSKGGFKSNLALGGDAVLYDYDEKVIDIALKAAKAINLEICGVDILLGGNNNYFVCEVNACPGFKTVKRTSGMDEMDILLTLIKDKMNEE